MLSWVAAWVMFGCCAEPVTGVVEMDCHYLACPSEDDMDDAYVIFDEHASLESVAPLVVEWHAPGETFGGWSDENGDHVIVGLTVNRDLVQVSSWPLLAHELMHVHHWRDSGNPDDAYHDQGPGPWTVDDNTVIIKVSAIYIDTFTGPTQ